MKIEHVAMYVNDLEGARDFFMKYLGGTSNDGYHITGIPVSVLISSVLMTAADWRS